jgi:hypothetical protein
MKGGAKQQSFVLLHFLIHLLKRWSQTAIFRFAPLFQKWIKWIKWIKGYKQNAYILINEATQVGKETIREHMHSDIQSAPIHQRHYKVF